jgi:hypothetical protein
MKNILNSQIFLNSIKTISFSNNFSKYSESFNICFKFFNYHEYCLSNESYSILLKCELIDKSINIKKIITNDDKLIQLIFENINDPKISYLIEQINFVSTINFSHEISIDKIVQIFNHILQFKIKQYSIKYINFMIYLISQYFNQKAEQNQINLIKSSLEYIIDQISKLKNQSSLKNEIYWIFSQFQFELIYLQRNKSEIQQAFNELYEIFLEIFTYQITEINISESIYFLFHYGLTFSFENISYEMFNSIIFLCSGLPRLHEKNENILRILFNVLDISDRLSLKNHLVHILSQKSPNSDIIQERLNDLTDKN